MSVIKTSDYVIEINTINADWDFADTFRDVPHLIIHSVEFCPAAANDKVVLRTGGINGPIFFEATCSGVTENKNKEFGSIPFKPYLCYNDGVYTNGCRLIIILREIPQPRIH